VSPEISVIVLNWNGREYLAPCLRAVLAQEDVDFETILVDNASSDGSVELVRREFPRVRCVALPDNRGFAAGNNAGATHAAGRFLAFLNNDTVASPHWLRALLTGINPDTGFALATSRIVYMHDAAIVDSAGDGLLRWGAAFKHHHGQPARLADESREVFGACGAAFLIARQVFEELGGFDEAFTSDGAFANEDADFGVELLARFNVRHHPAAISRQRYVVGPRELMDRAPLWASGDIRFVRKHPHLCRDLFKARGSTQRRTRFLFGPLARVNLIAAALRHVGVWGADIALRSPFRSSRTFARIFDGARSVAYWNELRRRGWFPASERVLVLCYHSIAGSSQHPADRFTVTAEALARQLDQLSARGFEFISPALFEAYLLHDAPMPRRAVLLTFDDGYADLMVTARDILEPRGIEAVAFVLTRPTSDHNDWDKGAGLPKRQLLAASQFQALAQSGIEIASHGRTHRELPSMPLAERTNEIDGSFNDLAELGLKPRFFAYPYGEVSADSIEAVAGSHFVAAFGADAGWVNRRSQRFNLPRTVVTARDRGWRFRLKTGAPRLYNWVTNPADQPRYLLRKLAGFISGPK